MAAHAGPTGGIEENEAIIRANLATFGVADRVHLIVGTSEQARQHIPEERKFGMLILDADGAIDRDLALFANSLTPNATIIIDDYCHAALLIRILDGSSATIDQKQRLAALLVDLFEHRGVLRRELLLERTWFGRKVGDSRPEIAFGGEEVIAVYRQLTFGSGSWSLNIRSRISNAILRRTPRVHSVLRRARARWLE